MKPLERVTSIRLQPQAEGAPLHRIVRVMRHDALVLRFDPGKELENETPRAELIADQVKAIGLFSLHSMA